LGPIPSSKKGEREHVPYDAERERGRKGGVDSIERWGAALPGGVD